MGCPRRYYCSVGDRGSFPSLPLVRKGWPTRPSRLMARELARLHAASQSNIWSSLPSIGAGPTNSTRTRAGPVSVKIEGLGGSGREVNDAVMYKRPRLLTRTIIERPLSRLVTRASPSTPEPSTENDRLGRRLFAAALTLTCLGEDSKLTLVVRNSTYDTDNPMLLRFISGHAR